MKPSIVVSWLKRFMDFAAGSAGLIGFALTWPLIALLIKLESPGPVLYRQERVGFNRRRRMGRPAHTGEERRRADYGGKPFHILKYRTMRPDAEAGGPQLCAKGLDPRVTRLGKWLRALHIDEIPQFINLVRGEMSLIGPRPERPHFTMEYGKTLPHYSDRTYLIKPGITGLAQIMLGYDDSHESVIRKSHYDLSYRASFCSLSAWLKMEWWIAWNTIKYLCQKPRFEGETRDLRGLKRAKLLPFQGRAASPLRTTLVSISFGKAGRPMLLAGHSPSELAARLDAIDFAGKPRPEIFLRPKENLDLEDMGFIIQLAHKARRHGAKLCLRSPNLKVQKILREIHLDAVLDVQHAAGAVRNFLTVDVECWFHAYNMRAVAPKCAWHLQPTRIVKNMETLLELMRANQTKATFFILGWVADHFPEVVRMIDSEGHEIGTHGYHHDLLTEMTPSEFEHDLAKSLEAIGRHTSQRVRGHRASNFTLVKSTLWALEIMLKHGIEYDSSIFPIARKRYGIPDYPNRLPHTLQLETGATLREIPMSTLKMGGRLYPIGGGGYLRLYPLGLTERYIEQANLRGLPAMVYLHPWEVDLQQGKRYLGGAMKTFQHYVNMDTTEWKLNRLLQRFDFSPVAENMELPRIERLFRRNPVQVLGLHPDQYTAARSSAYARALESGRIGVREADLEADLVESQAG